MGNLALLLGLRLGLLGQQRFGLFFMGFHFFSNWLANRSFAPPTRVCEPPVLSKTFAAAHRCRAGGQVKLFGQIADGETGAHGWS